MAGGRPKIEYDKKIAEQVQAMSQYGTPQEEIAEMVGMSKPTLCKLYKKELAHGFNIAKLSARKKIYERVMAGDPLMLIFYAKTQLGWSEKPKDADNAAQPLPLYTCPPKASGKAE